MIGKKKINKNKKKKRTGVNVDPSRALEVAAITYHLRLHAAPSCVLRERKRQITLGKLLRLGYLRVLFKPRFVNRRTNKGRKIDTDLRQDDAESVM